MRRWSVAPSRADRAAAPPAKPWWPVPSRQHPARAASVGSAGCAAAIPDASAASLAGFLAGNVAPPAAVTTDGWPGDRGLGAAGYEHEAINLSRRWGDAVLRLPAIHLVFGLAKRWLLGTHHGAVSKKHLQAYLDEYVFRFNRRTAKSISHRFARLVEQAVVTMPITYRAIVGQTA